jgi:POT family proton-dependent oligopeptide transporter
MPRYRTRPLASTRMPPGIPFIVGNEAAERFSFYGMRAILVVFMTQHLVNAAGELDVMSEAEAKGWFHLFVSAVYFTPLLGALISDGLLGKYRSIIALSLVYCLGHFVLALDDTRTGLAIGLGLIALGAGGIKPCVSAHVGDQFGPSNRHLLPKAFSWFYFAINLGAFSSTLITPWLLARYGSSPAFALPGILMLLATIIFWAGRHRFVHVPPGGRDFLRDALGATGLGVLAKLSVVFVFIAVFWSLFDQTGSAWVLQARHMDREVFGIELLPAQLQAANPLLVMLLIPIFAYGLYPVLERAMPLTPLRKIAIGLFLTAFAFLVPTLAQEAIDAGLTPHIGWQLLAYLLLTSGEVMVSITALEFAYTQAPLRMKAFVMSLFMLSIAAGNLFTSTVNFLIDTGVLGGLEGAAYYWFFTTLMAGAALLFLLVVRFYREKTYIHDEEPVVPMATPEP